jgi:hypothetical protein
LLIFTIGPAAGIEIKTKIFIFYHISNLFAVFNNCGIADGIDAVSKLKALLFY